MSRVVCCQCSKGDNILIYLLFDSPITSQSNSSNQFYLVDLKKSYLGTPEAPTPVRSPIRSFFQNLQSVFIFQNRRKLKNSKHTKIFTAKYFRRIRRAV